MRPVGVVLPPLERPTGFESLLQKPLAHRSGPRPRHDGPSHLSGWRGLRPPTRSARIGGRSHLQTTGCLLRKRRVGRGLNQKRRTHAMRVYLCVTGLALSVAMLSPAGADEPHFPRSTPAATPQVPPFDEMLHRYLLDQARQQFDARRKAIAAIKTPEDIARRQKELRGFFLRSLGDLPERTPLNPRVVGTLQARRLSRRENHLREPAQSPCDGESLHSRRKATVSGRALAVRSQRQRQGLRRLSTRMPSCWPRNGMAVLVLRPDRPG